MDTSPAESEVLTSFLHTWRVVTYRKTEIILRAGDTPQGVYCIRSGYVKVYSLTDDGNENVHIIYKPGELFPLIWAFKGTLREVYYEALDDVEAWIVPRAKFVGFVRSDMAAAMAALQQMTEQFHVYTDRVDNLQYTSAHHRVVYRLLLMSTRFGRRVRHGTLIEVPVTHQVIAGSLNLSRETVSRVIEKLEQKGLVKLVGRRLLIRDVPKLRHEMSEAA